ncbi:UvrD-helicase domain-containing protein [Streptosporangium roseum]|uniref:UvrD-helicase domain-containing protein n=1 Tax=Streptosporangium roseum TaxID=2001 RepID=UPI003330EC8F
MRPTTQQQAVIDEARAGKTLTVQAGAGSGKSTTLRAVAEAMPGTRILCVVYNKSVRLELRGKMPRNVACHTNHSYAMQIIRNHWSGHLDRMKGNRQTGAQQANILCLSGPVRINANVVLSPAQRARLAMAAINTWCKSAELDLLPEHIKAPMGISDRADVQRLREVILPVAHAARADIRKRDGQLKWQHDYYLKMAQLLVARGGMTLPYDLIMVDECQDTNEAAADLYLFTQAATQRIIVGDSAQAINGWNGSVDILRTFPADQLLFLSKSFRFGPAIAEEANKWLTLLGAPLRLEGHEPVGSTIGPIDQPDAVLCRTNAAAMGEVFTALKNGRTPALVGGGGEIERLAEAAELLQAGLPTDHPDLCAFPSWAMVRDYVENDPLGNDLKVFADLVDSYGATTVRRAAKQVKDAEHALPGDTVISTGHRSKGLEWRKVRAAGDFRAPNADSTKSGDTPVNREELMLNYVTVTRAMERLDRGSLAWIDDYVPGTRPAAAPRSRRRAVPLPIAV